MHQNLKFEKIILASNSPRRKELLKLIGIDFEVKVANVDETIDSSLSLVKSIEDLAFKKANGIEANDNEIVIGADTVVVLNNEIIGKPIDEIDAINTLKKLNGKKHQVITSVCIKKGNYIDCFSDITDVYMYEVDEQVIIDYVASLEPLDKAGSYAIQGLGAILVEKIVGDYYSVMGLPISKLYQKLKSI